jgi:hypothetical protein
LKRDLPDTFRVNAHANERGGGGEATSVECLLSTSPPTSPPPPLAPRLGANESNSSKNSTHGAAARARANSVQSARPYKPYSATSSKAFHALILRAKWHHMTWLVTSGWPIARQIIGTQPEPPFLELHGNLQIMTWRAISVWTYRTARSLSPTYLLRSSGPLMEMKLALASLAVALAQGLTLVHFPAQLERFLWDMGARRGCVVRVKGVLWGV